MGETLEKDFFLNPEVALDEGFEIKREMNRTQAFFDKAAEIEKRMLDLAYEIPADVRSNELIESCEEAIRNIERSDFAEYGERIDRNIKLLDEESTQSVNKLKNSLSSANNKLDEVISMAEELCDELSYEKYEGNTTISVKATESFASAGSSESKTAEVSEQEPDENVKFSEQDEIDAYVDFIMAERPENTDNFLMRSKIRNELANLMKNGGKKNYKTANGASVTFYSTKTSFEDAYNAQISRKPPTTIWSYTADKFVTATDEQVKYAMIPYLHIDGNEKYQFVRIDEGPEISKEMLKDMLMDEGVLEGQEDYFIQASEETGLSAVYLAGHAINETGHGKSVLSCGYRYLDQEVFNMYGYNANDGEALHDGARMSYKLHWYTKRSAIIGGAKEIKQHYVIERGQNIRYEMNWHTDAPGSMQYSSDVNWANSQTKMNDAYAELPQDELHFCFPVYREVDE